MDETTYSNKVKAISALVASVLAALTHSLNLPVISTEYIDIATSIALAGGAIYFGIKHLREKLASE